MNKKINHIMATKVLGWEIHTEITNGEEVFSFWKDKDDEFHGYVVDFNPAEDMNDALLIADKLYLTLNRTFDGWQVFHANASSSQRDCQYIGTTNHQKWIENEFASMAICLCALQQLGIVLEEIN